MQIPAPVLRAAVGAEEAAAAGAAPNAVDVALADGGTLRGQVVDAGGSPVAETPVAIWQLNREVAGTVTDRSGCFAVSGLRGGTYQLTAAGGLAVYRLWGPNTAPPSARPAALIVVGDEQLVRQQGPVLQWLRCHPWFVVGLAATAVAVPIAIHNSNKAGPASPP
jgi:hypothetical protein